MQLIKFEPFKEIDRLFDDRFFPVTSMSKIGFDLAVDVFEEDGNVVAKMSLPGIKPEDVDISLEDDTLTISGKREEEKEVDKKDYYSKEIRRGSFTRSVSLPKLVDTAKSEAKYKNGILIVTMPAIKESKEKATKIKVKE